MKCLMVSADPHLKCLIDLVNGFIWITKELIPNGSEQSLRFSAPLGLEWRRMDQVDPVFGTNKFQMAAHIGSPMICVETLRESEPPDGTHEIMDQ